MTTTTRWVRPPSELSKSLDDNYLDKVYFAVYTCSEFWALHIQNEAQKNAPWTDRTGLARNGLLAFIEELSRDTVKIYLTTQAPYGVYLELSNSGKYAIVWPTIVKNLPELLKLLRQIFA